MGKDKKNEKLNIDNELDINSKNTSLFQKIAVIFLAFFLFLSMIPVGLMPMPEKEEEPSEFVRISPIEARYTDDKGRDDVKKIGRDNSVLYTFNIDRFVDMDDKAINSAKLRFSFVNGSGCVNNIIVVDLADGLYAQSLLSAGERIALLKPTTTDTDDTFAEVDMTGYVKALLDKGKSEFTIRLSGRMGIDAYIATNSYSDPMYRPCLNVAIGDTYDTDAKTLKRATLKDAVFVSREFSQTNGKELADKSGSLYVGDGNEMYLKFDVDGNSVLGAVRSSILSLNKIGEEKAGVKVYCINNDEWTAEQISFDERPRGDESTMFSSFSAPIENSGRISFDVTQAVSQAQAHGIKTLTFRITGNAGEKIGFSGFGDKKTEPRLYIKASDDKNIVCSSEAALSALGNNRDDFVTMKLLEEYSSQNGEKARIRWSEYSADGEINLKNESISAKGDVTRPKWFEQDKEVLAIATISSGRYRTERSFSIKIPAESAPDLSRYKFDNYIDIGDSDEEKEQKLEMANVSAVKRRWIGGRAFTSRAINENGVMVLNLACTPDEVNYLTLKLWQDENYQSDDLLLTTAENKKEYIALEYPTYSSNDDGGFVYATYALPTSFTNGKSKVSLRLISGEKSEETEIYAAYLTQNPFFEPKQFSKQGEKLITDVPFGEMAISRFIENIKSLAIPVNDDEIKSTTPFTKHKFSVDKDSKSIVVSGERANIAFSVNDDGTALVYQRLEYYDKYSQSCPVIYDGDIIAINYGGYKLVWNTSESSGYSIPYDKMDMSGVFAEIYEQKYYMFGNENERIDDSIVPDAESVADGREFEIGANEVRLFVHIAEPIGQTDWRVSRINGKNVLDLKFKDAERIETITVKSVGGMPNNTDYVNALIVLYENERIVSMANESVYVVDSMSEYNIDMTEYDLYMKKGLTAKFFVYDKNDKLTELLPTLEL